MKTTAELRVAAREAEERCDFGIAAVLYAEAALCYPRTLGDLARADRMSLHERSAECARASKAAGVDRVTCPVTGETVIL